MHSRLDGLDVLLEIAATGELLYPTPNDAFFRVRLAKPVYFCSGSMDALSLDRHPILPLLSGFCGLSQLDNCN